MGYAFLTLIFAVFVFVFLLIVVASAVRIVNQGYVGVVERLGRYKRTARAGLMILIPFVDTMRKVSMKEQVDDYPPQAVITKDNVTVNVDAVLFYQIMDPVLAMYEVENYIMALEKITLTTLRNIIGELTLDETLVSRETINTRLRDTLDAATDKWGIKVNRVEIKTIAPPREIQDAMEQQMKAERNKRAMILTSEGERQSAILRAEGTKQAAILDAEGARQSAILTAEGRAQAYRELFGALKGIGLDDKLVAVRYIEALERVANGTATKLVVPYEASAVLGALKTLVESAQTSSPGQQKPER